MSLLQFCQFYEKKYCYKYFIFNSSVATKEITILYKPDGTPDTDLKAYIEPLTTTSTSSTTTTPTTTTPTTTTNLVEEGESCVDTRKSKKMHTWKPFNWI